MLVIPPEKKLEYLREQIVEIKAGLLTFITCPYCGTENTPADTHLCCPLFAEATAAILDRMEQQEAVDFLSAIQDRVN
jgi:hypothetical protein